MFDQSITLEPTLHSYEYIRFRPGQQTRNVANDHHFAAAAGMRHVDAVRIGRETDGVALIAADIGNDHRVALGALEGIYRRHTLVVTGSDL